MIDIVMGRTMHVQDAQRAFFGHHDPRRRIEKEDSRLVAEDHRAVANLSPNGYQVQFDHEYKPKYLRQ